jgi:transposase
MESDPETVEARIVQLHERGLTREEIRAQLGCGTARIQRAINMWKEKHVIADPKPMGRPRKITEPIRTFIEVRTLQDARLAGTQLAHEIMGKFGVQVHPSTIVRMRNGLDFQYQPPRHVQALTEKQIADRITFCRKMLLQNSAVLGCICFSDESRIVLGDDKQWVWYRKGENNPSSNVEIEKFPKALMVFAVIGQGYKSKILFVEGTINADKYMQNINNLQFIEELDQLHGPFQWIFQQDGARCHTAHEVVDWLEESVDLIVDWPANSPDLNPIELLWAVLKAAVQKFRPETLDDLKVVLQAAWDSISQDTIDRLVASFPARLKLCEAVGGQSISNDLWRMANLKEMLQEERIRLTKRLTSSEDETLTELHFIHHSRWKSIARHFKNRNALSPMPISNANVIRQCEPSKLI